MENNPVVTPIQVSQPSSPPKNTIIKPLLLIFSFLSVASVSFLLGAKIFQKSNSTTIKIPSETNKDLASEIVPYGTSAFSFTQDGDNIYLKHTVTLTDNQATLVDSEARQKTQVYTYDDSQSLDTKEVVDFNTNQHSWTDLVTKNIYPPATSSAFTVDDHLFSFKKVPNTDNFLFVVDWSKTVNRKNYQSNRTVYYYNQSQKRLSKIITITNMQSGSYPASFPKINSFSSDSRYVSIDIYGCWNCGGHLPEILLVNLETLKTKSIGQADSFLWKENGQFTYKEAVSTECTNEENDSVCYKNDQPLITGQF